MRARLRGRGIRVGVVAAISACGFTVGVRDELDGGIESDGGIDSAKPTPCGAVNEVSCGGPDLLVCRVVGQLPEATPCTWSCVDSPLPHCGTLVPSGGAVLPGDLLADPRLGANVVITDAMLYGSDDSNGSAGEITNVRGSGAGYVNGIEFQVVGNVAVFRFTNLTVNGTLALRGSRAVALVATGNITINGLIDVGGTCSGRRAGPGGFDGGSGRQNAMGPGSGAGATGVSSGGGGGGHGAGGGRGGGGSGGVAGAPHGDPTIAVLQGGGGGGGGGSADSELAGGGGGGALQLVANGTIALGGASGINAGGCGGNGSSDYGGGGGGAGGTILIEAANVDLLPGVTLAVNGGGGGGGSGDDGADATLSTMQTAGGPSGTGGSGGSGGALGFLMGGSGLEPGQHKGGGGGGVGRIRINVSPAGTLTGHAGATVSPGLQEVNTTATTGSTLVE